MVEGSASAPIARRPQHEQESAVSTGSKNNKITAYSATSNKESSGIGRQRIRLNAVQEFRTPSERTRGTSESQNERRYRRQQHYDHTVPYGSPFASPPPTTTTRRRKTVDSKSIKARPAPLVLDPAARSLPGHLGACNSEHRRVTLQSTRSASLMDSGGRNSAVQKLFQVATQGIREHHATAAQYPTSGSSLNAMVSSSGYLHATPTAIDAAYGTTASSGAAFARSNGVVQAGFLQKLGKNIPEFKRRFFVLKPETSLYYYLSPNETDPRGKIDLEGSTIEEIERSSDGRFRFVVSVQSGDPDVDKTKHGNNIEHQQKPHQIVLEARSTEIGEEWIRHMKGERVSYLKERNEALTSTATKQANQITDLEQQIKHFRMIEADRDGALEDARNWKNKFNRLDEALRLLTQQIRTSLTTPLVKEEGKGRKGEEANEVNAESQIVDGEKESTNLANDDNKSPDHTLSSSNQNVCDEVPDNNTDKTLKKSNALLDNLTHEDMDVEEIMDVPGTYFSGLSNAFKQQRESSRLASIEASAAVDDVLQANERVEVIQKRMHKAEKQIIKLWEENCDIRKTLKHKKREKRVLVKEVKQLQQIVHDLEANAKLSSRVALERVALEQEKAPNEDGPMADTMIGSDEERLIIELEEHVASSIRLHEQLLAGTDFDRDMEQSISTEPASVNFDATNVAVNGGRTIFGNGELETSKAKLLSLFDDETDSDDESSMPEQESKDFISRIDTQSQMESIASSADNMAVDQEQSVASISSHRVNPLFELDNEKDEEQSEGKPYSAKPSMPKLVTENGHATSRLECPLADVVDVRGLSTNGNDVGSSEHEGNEDLRVHHLTFYSQKIGLQFQKASPAPVKARGLLTDAVTADMVEEVEGSDKTAAELRSVASIASMASGGIIREKKQLNRSQSSPEDIVLVCGFEGFDDSGVNRRPKLGSRLVAFDGISVEVGKWTFQSIRRAIKSRGRPLTLSFRNDYLTTEQRTILTKAVKDVDAKRDPVYPIPKYERLETNIPSLSTASSFESGHFLNKNDDNRFQAVHRSRHTAGRNLDLSTAATEIRRLASSSSSISSDFRENHVGRIQAHPPPSSSVSTHKSRNSGTSVTENSVYSFSEVGSSSAASSLMDIVVKKVSSTANDLVQQGGGKPKDEGFKQNRRFGNGMNPSGTRQHQDFQANLL